MKYAILVGVRDEDPAHRFEPEPSLTAMAAALDALGGWSVVRVAGAQASRKGILAALAQLEPRVGEGDTVLFYFFGHGGVVEIGDLPPPLGGRPVFYLATGGDAGGWRFEGVLDIELSRVLARLDRRCANVIAILDSCYSAQLVRGPVWPLAKSPDWLRAAWERQRGLEDAALLDPSAHPQILRLAASSSLRHGYGDPVAGGHLGRLTQLLCEVLREAGDRVTHLTWDALTHRIRERAIWRLGCEEQWISLAGPRQRLVFSRREAPLPRTVGFVPRGEEGGGWIRAGALQGVEVGDEWGLAELLLDEDMQPRLFARMRVSAVDLNRASLEPLPGGARTAPAGTSALLVRAARRDPVFVSETMLAQELERSAWVRPEVEAAGAFATAIAIDSHPDTDTDKKQLELRCRWADFAPLQTPADSEGRRAALERLEDWARARRLVSLASSSAPRATGIHLDLRWIPTGHGRSVRLEPGARVQVGGQLRARLRSDPSSARTFVSVLVIDVAGRPVLFDDAEPDGLELLPGESREVGVGPRQRTGGFELTWPAGADLARARALTVIVLASGRPLELGHLVDTPARGVPSDQPRITRAPTRGRRTAARPRTGPELSRFWGAFAVQVELDPRPAQTP